MKSLFKLVVIVVIVLLIWKKGIPWWQANHGKSASSSSTATAGGSCIELAEHASEVWGSGLARFANPPYDLGAEFSFFGEIRGRGSVPDFACWGMAFGCTTG